jgi:hypothetical protein
MIRLVLIALLLWACATGAHIYRWINDNGTFTYSDQPSPPGVDRA